MKYQHMGPIANLSEKLRAIEVTALRANYDVLGSRPIDAANTAIAQAADEIDLMITQIGEVCRRFADDVAYWKDRAEKAEAENARLREALQ